MRINFWAASLTSARANASMVSKNVAVAGEKQPADVNNE